MSKMLNLVDCLFTTAQNLHRCGRHTAARELLTRLARFRNLPPDAAVEIHSLLAELQPARHAAAHGVAAHPAPRPCPRPVAAPRVPAPPAGAAATAAPRAAPGKAPPHRPAVHPRAAARPFRGPRPAQAPLRPAGTRRRA